MCSNANKKLSQDWNCISKCAKGRGAMKSGHMILPSWAPKMWRNQKWLHDAYGLRVTEVGRNKRWVHDQCRLRGRFRTVRTQRPIVSKLSCDHPENHPPLGEQRPQGKNSRFRQQSGIVSWKCSLFSLIIRAFGLTKNLSSLVYGNTIAIVLPWPSGDFRTAHGAPPVSPKRGGIPSGYKTLGCITFAVVEVDKNQKWSHDSQRLSLTLRVPKVGRNQECTHNP